MMNQFFFFYSKLACALFYFVLFRGVLTPLSLILIDSYDMLNFMVVFNHFFLKKGGCLPPFFIGCSYDCSMLVVNRSSHDRITGLALVTISLTNIAINMVSEVIIMNID